MRYILVHARQQSRRLRLYELKGEALEVVALGQGGGVVDAVCEIGEGDAGEGVGVAGVAAYGEEAGVLAGELEDVGEVAVIEAGVLVGGGC